LFCILSADDMKEGDDFVKKIKNAMEMENIRCPKMTNGYINNGN